MAFNLFLLPKDNRHRVAIKKIKKSFGYEVVTNVSFKCQDKFVIISQHIKTRKNSCTWRTTSFRTALFAARPIAIYFYVFLSTGKNEIFSLPMSLSLKKWGQKDTLSSLMYASRLLLDPQRATYQATSFFFFLLFLSRILWITRTNQSSPSMITIQAQEEQWNILRKRVLLQRLVQLLNPAPFPCHISIFTVRYGPVKERSEMVVTFKVITRVAHWRIVCQQNISLEALTAVNFR